MIQTYFCPCRIHSECIMWFEACNKAAKVVNFYIWTPWEQLARNRSYFYMLQCLALSSPENLDNGSLIDYDFLFYCLSSRCVAQNKLNVIIDEIKGKLNSGLTNVEMASFKRQPIMRHTPYVHGCDLLHSVSVKMLLRNFSLYVTCCGNVIQ